MERSVNRQMYAQDVDMGGIKVGQPLPTQQVDQWDPFLLMHYGNFKFKEGSDPKTSGIGPHPHRGFSPISFIYSGSIHHRDSRGNSSIVHAGGTQWTDAGMGIIHSERPTKDLAETGGYQELIQLWVNTPAKDKMNQPAYFPLSKEDTPTKTAADGKTKIAVVSGSFEDMKGGIKPNGSINAIRVSMETNGSYYFELPENHNAMLFVIDGELNLHQGVAVEKKNLVLFNKDGKGVRISAKKDSEVLLLSGLPVDEEVTQYGPFVMTTQTEIMEAMRDYQQGKMGFLVEDFD